MSNETVGRLRRTISITILAWLVAAPGWAASLALGTELDRLGRQAKRQNVPILFLFSRAGCDWCERVRREYLVPMTLDAAYRGRVIIRQIDSDSDSPLTDFTGRRTTHRAFAESNGGMFTPTVLVVGPGGERLAEPIVGFRLADFYGAYLDRAIDQGIAKLR